MFSHPAKVGLSSSIPQSILNSIYNKQDLEQFEDAQRLRVMGSKLDLSQENFPLNLASTESNK